MLQNAAQQSHVELDQVWQVQSPYNGSLQVAGIPTKLSETHFH